MRIPIIKAKDGGYEHIVGTNSHDVRNFKRDASLLRRIS